MRFRIYLLLALLIALSAAANAQMGTAECLGCHSDPSASKEVDGKQVSVHVNEQNFKNSIHAAMECAGCHGDIKSYPHQPKPAAVNCATCHEESVNKYKTSIHAAAVQKGSASSATCASCHGNVHEILPSSDANSKTNHAHVPATCAACHSNAKVMAGRGVSTGAPSAYMQGVHGRAIGDPGAPNHMKAAVCSDCHNGHDVRSAGDPQSPTFKFNVPATCAKCHGEEQKQFITSIHGQAVARGSWRSPVCTDCHGVHLIKPKSDPTSPIAANQLATVTCGRCHESVRMAEEFGMKAGRTSSFMDSYHGLAVRGGSRVAANCASCHGVHNILPSNDPKSTIAPANLVKTCGACHPGANENFAKGEIHINAPLSADIGSIAVRWTRSIYLGMIFAIIGGMIVHNLIIWRRKAIEKRKAQRRIVTRMSDSQRIQHLLLLTSFITLVLTGFALTYPESWYGKLFIGETVRGWIHRIAGVVLIAVSLYHLVYMFAKREGRTFVKDMLPAPKDVGDVVGVMKYYLGLSSVRPQLPRFTYAEKAEYWALVWGTIVMAVTGVGLWAKVFVGNILPRWTLDLFTAIHFYEAVLATLAIIVWHFYWVIFDPDVYPMNWAWKDGKMDIELYHHEHGGDHETIEKSIEEAAAKNAGDD